MRTAISSCLACCDERPAPLPADKDAVLLIEDFHLEISWTLVFHLLTAWVLKLIADKFEEHEAQHHVLVLRGFYAAAKLVRGIPMCLQSPFFGFWLVLWP